MGNSNVYLTCKAFDPGFKAFLICSSQIFILIKRSFTDVSPDETSTEYDSKDKSWWIIERVTGRENSAFNYDTIRSRNTKKKFICGTTPFNF